MPDASSPTAPPPVASGDFKPSIAGLLRRIESYDPSADLTRIEAAYDVAANAHNGQRRDNGDAYITHPIAVANILAGFRMDATSIMVGLLHDTVEDTGVSCDSLKARFGEDVAALVDGVTKLTRLELQSDRTKQAENFRKLVLAMSRDIRVLIVKLADRLHNMRTLHYVQRTDRRQRIARETMDIYAPLAERIGMDRVKTELQNLSFAQLEPEADATIRARLNFLRGQGADVIEQVRQELMALCAESGIDKVEVTGREKSPYSIWEKMQRRNVAFEQLSDIMAFRLLVPTRDACYMALGAIHGAYPMIAGRFKDYISTPKANGYQSLHTGVTLRHPRNQKIEVQIRTAEMHDLAENGVASHWAYKEHATPSEREAAALSSAFGAPTRKLRWVQDLLEILEDSQAPDEFLENTKLELYQDQVFCFTPKGQLISLPRGATPVDFAYAVHSQVGDTCVGAKVNGRLMPLRHELQNGDQVEIMTARGGTPSPSWERFVATGKARARIRRFVAQQQRQVHLDNGRAAIAKAFRQEGVDGSEKVLDGILKELRQASVEDLYVSVGNGQLGPKDVVNTAYPELRQSVRAPRMVPGLSPRFGQSLMLGAGHAGSKNTATHSGSTIKGIGSGIAISFAGCCRPLPGDPIVGIIAQGKGVTIHRRGCQNLSSFADTPERFLEVDWDYEALGRRQGAEPYTARLSVVAANEPEVLATLTNVAAKHNGSVINLKIVNRQLDFMEILVDLEVKDLRHLSSMIAAFRTAVGVMQVERAKG
ncbi:MULTISPECIES: RelA/SpoT family protein [Gluconobacter]|uniref:GTP pyrophosphokinase rsh n=4 Tax=Gluconobacter TaxID=441 RepID=A0A829WQF4_GLUOY|nr:MULTISPECIES: bifunctional (p)ppGpp synthetase/guanosine-3',5'-bis(diphosphate) 3'-pyrophosphohydrolase [Gluconobacter]AHK71800.1 GTP pyrophosphokinase Rsh [Gluconobacter oxydans DSM 3504]KXV01099.1 GTP pyrophosphokinase [Gluconobacter potus]KXV07177.1 GTP pyrophosphokinase [Gluconobacter oxydans]GEM17385.1 GTP pyrophosphokinase [Gluconobacter oxydans NBRC 3293]